MIRDLRLAAMITLGILAAAVLIGPLEEWLARRKKQEKKP